MSEAALRRVGRRADGWLPAGVIPRLFAPETFVAQREVIRQAAREAGRGDREPATVLRANVERDTSVAQVADALHTVAERTGISDMFVDLMYVASDVDDALELASRVLAAVRPTAER
jgi:alkanesulfonate monooxygenase SsuD/methylene tetrahydromethanopterin reductase-like flavin-dependent oxidoreductase (luciferase family)